MNFIEQTQSKKPVVIAGPCAIESKEQIFEIAAGLHKLGVTTLRCQFWKPRTKKESFQGVGEEGFEWIKEIKEKYRFLVATEIIDASQIEATKGVSDILWVGSRNMQNFELLKKLSEDDRPVILKRGFIATIDEWMASAKYIDLDRVVLCERGIRTGADSMRFTLDLNTALVAKHDYKMPVIVDPSHSAGRSDMVEPLALAALAAGLDGVVIEVHSNPTEALSDKDQQLTLEQFSELYKKVESLASVISK